MRELMSFDTDLTNRDRLINLVEDHWYLDKRSTNKVVECIIEPPHHIFIDQQFDEQDRLIIPVPHNPELDPGYRDFVKKMTEYRPSFIEKYPEAILFDTWVSGKLSSGQKLFKLLYKEADLPESIIESWSTSRNGDEKFFIVSKNPIDWLFCSTNQSFGSCMSLTSSHSEAVYMGYPWYWCMQDTYLLFLTTGKLRRYTIKGYEFKHFRVLSRSVGVITSKKQMAVIRYYPTKIVSFEPLLNKIGFDSFKYKPNHRNLWFSLKHTGSPKLFFKNGTQCYPYLDCAFNYATHELSNVGISGCRMNFDWCEGFENLSCVEDLYSGRRHECYHCGSVYYEDDIAYLENYERNVCDECLHEDYIQCDDCDYPEWIHNDDAYWIDYRGAWVCDYHKSRNYGYCYSCDELFHLDDLMTLADSDSLCENCRDEHSFECTECGDQYTNDSRFEDTEICEGCIDNIKCDRDDLITRFEELMSEIASITHRFEELTELIGDNIDLQNYQEAI